jgi:hypothetical protein
MPWLSIQNHRRLEYLAAWEVHRGKLFGRCEEKNRIAPTERLLARVMSQEPYRSPQRVFSIMDNGSAHRGQKAAQWIRSRWPIATLGATHDLAWRERFLIIKCRKMFRKQLIVTICIREPY